ncbi:hypothetical protein MICRO8M_100095 [Microbacterium sp. 8M]|nr:hypothetical protein MICRO8M_100095 [Microbacterium sp. 8M]
MERPPRRHRAEARRAARALPRRRGTGARRGRSEGRSSGGTGSGDDGCHAHRRIGDGGLRRTPRLALLPRERIRAARCGNRPRAGRRSGAAPARDGLSEGAAHGPPGERARARLLRRARLRALRGEQHRQAPHPRRLNGRRAQAPSDRQQS